MAGFVTSREISPAEIKRIRKKAGLTQKELGEWAAVSKSTVERWEMGSTPVTGPIVLVMQMLDRMPHLAEQYRIPRRETPLRLWYMYKNKTCSLLDVDERVQSVKVRNYTDQIMFRAFGAEEHPTYKDYQDFLASRCFPQERDKMKLVLQDLDLPFYDPLLIIEKTEGRMAEDDFWIKVEK